MKEYVVDEFAELGVTIEEPETTKEESFAHALEAFAQFVLIEQPEATQALLEQHSASVGELSGGNGTHSIYRITIHQNQEQVGAAELLLKEFSNKHPHLSLTVDKLQQYMLQMCNRRRRKASTYSEIQDCDYNRLGNLMFILSFGPIHGQVRHIDHMNPNLQICLYMSKHCPSTIVYVMKDPLIQNCRDLTLHWESMNSPVPALIQNLFSTMSDVPLKTKPYARYFAHWQTLNTQLANFGRLYQPVSHALQLPSCDPGTTLIAGGANHVHAGPPANEPRMFAFAIGIPNETMERPKDDTPQSTRKDGIDNDGENDGEVQYSPVLLHIDLCCILFAMLDFDTPDENSTHNPTSIYCAKRFLLQVLLPYLKEYPNETYSIHLGDERQLLREWLEELVEAHRETNSRRIETLLDVATTSDTLMYSPDVATKAFRKHQQRQQRRNQRQVKKMQNEVKA